MVSSFPALPYVLLFVGHCAAGHCHFHVYIICRTQYTEKVVMNGCSVLYFSIGV